MRWLRKPPQADPTPIPNPFIHPLPPKKPDEIEIDRLVEEREKREDEIRRVRWVRYVRLRERWIALAEPIDVDTTGIVYQLNGEKYFQKCKDFGSLYGSMWMYNRDKDKEAMSYRSLGWFEDQLKKAGQSIE